MSRTSRLVAAAAAMFLGLQYYGAAQTTAPAHATLFYSNDGLRLEAYFYKPPGAGPFPLLVYNHGSLPPGEEQAESPAPFIARTFVPAGYALLVPERRGYGKSEGPAFSKEVGADRAAKFVRRQQAEADDINAAVEYLFKSGDPSLDAKRVAIIGWSFGGIVTTLAASRSDRFGAAIVQAPGSLNWTRSDALRKVLIDAAARIRVPLSCAVAENDATTESARAICAAAHEHGARTVLKIYPPFNSGRERPGNPPGHALFGPFGVDRWRDDVLAFLADALRP